MKLGITGTREGMTQKQKDEFTLLIKGIDLIDEFHHGDCMGADAEAVKMVHIYHPEAIIVCHPPISNYMRAHAISHVTREPKDYIPRDHDIVDETDFMVATPKEMDEVLRSGTWATIRYSRKVTAKDSSKKLRIILPA